MKLEQPLGNGQARGSQDSVYCIMFHVYDIFKCEMVEKIFSSDWKTLANTKHLLGVGQIYSFLYKYTPYCTSRNVEPRIGACTANMKGVKKGSRPAFWTVWWSCSRRPPFGKCALNILQNHNQSLTSMPSVLSGVRKINWYFLSSLAFLTMLSREILLKIVN